MNPAQLTSSPSRWLPVNGLRLRANQPEQFDLLYRRALLPVAARNDAGTKLSGSFPRQASLNSGSR